MAGAPIREGLDDVRSGEREAGSRAEPTFGDAGSVGLAGRATVGVAAGADVGI